MANIFSTPAQANFINTYVPMPFDQMMQIGQMKQQRYGQGVQTLQQLEAQTEALKYSGEGADKEYILKTNKFVDELVDEYYGKADLSDVMVMREIDNKLNTIDKDRINRIQQTYAKSLKVQESKQRMFERGDFNPELDDDPIADWDSRAVEEGGMGVYDWMPRRHASLSESLDPLMKSLYKPRDLRRIETGPDAGMMIRGKDQTDLDEIIAGSQWNSSQDGIDQIRLWKQGNAKFLEKNPMTDDQIGDYIQDKFGQDLLDQSRTGSRYSVAYLKYMTGSRGGGIKEMFGTSKTDLDPATKNYSRVQKGIEGKREIVVELETQLSSAKLGDDENLITSLEMQLNRASIDLKDDEKALDFITDKYDKEFDEAYGISTRETIKKLKEKGLTEVEAKKYLTYVEQYEAPISAGFGAPPVDLLQDDKEIEEKRKANKWAKDLEDDKGRSIRRIADKYEKENRKVRTAIKGKMKDEVVETFNRTNTYKFGLPVRYRTEGENKGRLIDPETGKPGGISNVWEITENIKSNPLGYTIIPSKESKLTSEDLPDYFETHEVDRVEFNMQFNKEYNPVLTVHTRNKKDKNVVGDKMEVVISEGSQIRLMAQDYLNANKPEQYYAMTVGRIIAKEIDELGADDELPNAGIYTIGKYTGGAKLRIKISYATNGDLLLNYVDYPDRGEKRFRDREELKADIIEQSYMASMYQGSE